MFYSYQQSIADSSSRMNCEETQAKAHFKFVNKNFNALVHCSSELNCILQTKQFSNFNKAF